MNDSQAEDVFRLRAASEIIFLKESVGSEFWNSVRDTGIADGIAVRPLVPVAKDFNDDLLRLGPDALRAMLAAQLTPEDAWLCSIMVPLCPKRRADGLPER